jgi:hypothetical protein
MRRVTSTLLLSLIAGSGCIDTASVPTPAPPALDPSCLAGRTTTGFMVPDCLLERHLISPSHHAAAVAFLDSAGRFADSLGADTGYAAFTKAITLDRAFIRLGQFYADGLFADSARFNRMLDQVRVTIEDLRGNSIRHLGGHDWPATTPYLAWYNYSSFGLGYYFQPVTTVQTVAYLNPRPNVPTDSLLAIGDALYHYAVWHQHGNVRFPIWEYLFTWNSGGLVRTAPWQSGMAQGYVLMLFAELFKRTGDQLWFTRSKEVLTSMKVLWDDGGVMLPDTTHGYWWEEFHPLARVWNGSAQAVLGVGYFANVSGDSEAVRMFNRGIEAMKYYTPEYDTGSWVLYSKIQGYVSLAYRQSCVDILLALGAASGDPWFNDLAAKWKAYIPPPGVT